ncbi:hypothetical protein [Pinisolibacter sp.]|uniref:hypothetical protein n=1 Tax=Pinisolibacter sp. TaxID=2172024 RepID=UPI002FDD9129
MTDLDRWKHVEELNVYQISLLLAGLDPAPFERISRKHIDIETEDLIAPYLISLRNAIQSKKLEAIIIWNNGDFGYYDWEKTLIDIGALKEWLLKRGLTNNFFVPGGSVGTSFMVPWGSHYAPKLAAAVAAWEAVTSDPKRLRGKSPKQALEAWLTEHAAEYELVNKDGTPNKTGISEAAKVANWQPAGGAPKTPAPSPKPSLGFGQNPTHGYVEREGGFKETPPEDEVPF